MGTCKLKNKFLTFNHFLMFLPPFAFQIHPLSRLFALRRLDAVEAGISGRISNEKTTSTWEGKSGTRMS